MIVVTIGGGLGNQMFQYALYYKLKKMYPAQEVKLDLYNSFPPAHNGYEIEKVFNLKAEFCSKKDVIRLSGYLPLFKPTSIVNRPIDMFRRLSGFHKSSFIEQKDYTEYYDDYMRLQTEKSYLLKGVFANVRYFEDIKNDILSMYCFSPILDTNNLNIAKKIQHQNSVSIHLRRGDYVKCGIEMTSASFYYKAMQYMENTIGNDAAYFVFTDDIQYAMDLFRGRKNLEIVNCNSGYNNFRDMQLMSLCRHNIVANSSFSFWGAYLNINPNKVVIAPNLPFTGTKNPFVDHDWILFDN